MRSVVLLIDHSFISLLSLIVVTLVYEDMDHLQEDNVNSSKISISLKNYKNREGLFLITVPSEIIHYFHLPPFSRTILRSSRLEIE